MLENVLRVYEDVTGVIGCTPLIKLNKIVEDHGIKCQIWAKCDLYSSGGSSKDRIGLSMIQEAEKKGTIKPGDTIVEGTSGNTGIGLVLTALVRGYKSIITIPDKMSDEKINILKALGAKVIVTPTDVPLTHPDSYVAMAKRIGAEPGHFYINQYENQDNQLAHVQHTSQEVWEQMDGKLDYMFIAVGTCGTITGTGRGLHKHDPSIKIIGIDPVGSILARPVELNGPLRGYKMEGIGQSRVPGNMDYKEVHEFVKVDDKESFVMARELIEKEGIMVGGSCGSALLGTFNYLKEKGLDQDQNLRCVVFFSDGVRNYMSKLINDNWMVGNGYYPIERLQEADHPLADKTISDLKNLLPLPYYDARLTVNDCFDLFKKGQSMIPIRANGVITGVVTKNSLVRCVVEKKLHGMSSASHCTQREYYKVPLETPLSVIAKMLKTEVAVLVVAVGDNTKIRTIYILTQNEIMEIMHEQMKEII